MTTPNNPDEETVCYIPTGPQAGQTRKLKEAACFTGADAVEPTEHICIGNNQWHDTGTACTPDDQGDGGGDLKGPGDGGKG